MRYLLPFEYFRAVARAGSVRGAAESLALTPSALNRRIQDFEAELGIKLFDRSHEGMTFNAAGELVMDYVHTQKFETTKLRAQISDLKGLKKGSISIACTQALTTSALPTILSGFRVNHPFVTFDIRALRGRQEETLLDAKEIEFAVCLGRQREFHYESVFSAPASIGVVVTERHRLYDQKRIKAADLEGEDLSLPHPDFRMYEVLKRCFDARLLTITPAVQTDDFGLSQSLSTLDNTLSFRLIHPLSKAGDRSNYRLIPMDERDLPPVEIQILKLRSVRLTPLADRFLQEIISHFSL